MLGREAARVPSTPGFEDLRILAKWPQETYTGPHILRPASTWDLGVLPYPHSDVWRVRNTHVDTVPQPYAAQGNFGIRTEMT